MRNLNRNKLAKYISLISGPFIWIPFLFVIVILNAGLSPEQIKILAPAILFLDVVIPIGYLLLAPRLGLAKSWEMNDRTKRTPFYLLIITTTLLTLVIVYLVGSKILFALNITFVVLITLYLFINLRWKISGHAAMNTVGVLLISLVYGWQYLWLLVLVLPLVYWSRLKLGRHTIWQLVAGSGVSILVFSLGLRLFN